MVHLSVAQEQAPPARSLQSAAKTPAVMQEEAAPAESPPKKRKQSTAKTPTSSRRKKPAVEAAATQDPEVSTRLL